MMVEQEKKGTIPYKVFCMNKGRALKMMRLLDDELFRRSGHRFDSPHLKT